MPESIPIIKSEKQEQAVGFRELKPEEFWGGSVSLEGISQEEFAQKIKEAAEETGFTYSGYTSGEEYHFSRYPRRAFGPVAPIEKHQEALKTLAGKLGVEEKEEAKTEEPRFRVLLGLEEGYSEYKKKSIVEKIDKGEISDLETAKSEIEKLIGQAVRENNIADKINVAESLEEIKNILSQTNLGKNHTLEEVQAELGEGFDLRNASIYSAGSWGNYQEPAVVIEGNQANLSKVYALAEKFKQARIAVENLKDGKSHMVETKYCEDPDKE
ncbi:MAG: hypothetical protein COX30_03030 [Candidatus Moranbacteria bacterium CG23_combo_of_CG06-09_8_20_14_all_39_10]|nr:MAG: hypothetical protein COX30_03030 [Candidatus Moranbacteria bacterium CG23_combo_of_CG06-09_8_20_14_all_39_10]